MAKILETNVESRKITYKYSVLKILVISIIMGTIYLLLAWLAKEFIINPLACNNMRDAAMCLDSSGVAGNIAVIVTATLSIVVMLRLRIQRPLIIAVASAAILWDLARWTNNLMLWEIILWSLVFYALTYVLFSWISRYLNSVPVVIISTVIVVIARILVSL